MSAFLARPDIYSVVAVVDGRIVGSNFLTEEDTIAVVGPMTVDPAVPDASIGRRLMDDILERAERRRMVGIRLVQATFHRRSLALYSKLGFDVRELLVTMHGNSSIRRRHLVMTIGYLVKLGNRASAPSTVDIDVVEIHPTRCMSQRSICLVGLYGLRSWCRPHCLDRQLRRADSRSPLAVVLGSNCFRAPMRSRSCCLAPTACPGGVVLRLPASVAVAAFQPARQRAAAAYGPRRRPLGSVRSRTACSCSGVQGAPGSVPGRASNDYPRHTANGHLGLTHPTGLAGPHIEALRSKHLLHIWTPRPLEVVNEGLCYSSQQF
jgi:Acetyltransferase (GNAT) family